MDREEALATQAAAMEKDAVEMHLDILSECSLKSNRRSKIQSWLEDVDKQGRKEDLEKVRKELFSVSPKM